MTFHDYVLTMSSNSQQCAVNYIPFKDIERLVTEEPDIFPNGNFVSELSTYLTLPSVEGSAFNKKFSLRFYNGIFQGWGSRDYDYSWVDNLIEWNELTIQNQNLNLDSLNDLL